jgi:transposase
VEPQVIDGGMPAPGLVAHTLVSRFVDHLPYYRQEQINARSQVHTPRSTLAACGLCQCRSTVLRLIAGLIVCMRATLIVGTGGCRDE